MFSTMYIGLLAMATMGLPMSAITAPGQQNSDRTADTIASQNARQEPHMSAALGHLHEADAELHKATPDKGGHREKAMQLIQQAESETEQGIAYYNQHPGQNAPTSAPTALGQAPDRTADTVANQNSSREPHMSAALGHLHKAEAELQKSSPNKGGHRENAMQLIQQAESETDQGIAYYSQQHK